MTSRLTLEQLEEIMASRGQASRAKVGVRYGISATSVGRIWAGCGAIGARLRGGQCEC